MEEIQIPPHNKLIHDRTPEIIKHNGETSITRILNKKEYIEEIGKKIGEELTEYLEAENQEHKVEELADLLELINALAQHEGVTLEDVEKCGGFQGRNLFN